jgi:hypothetical protein
VVRAVAATLEWTGAAVAAYALGAVLMCVDPWDRIRIVPLDNLYFYRPPPVTGAGHVPEGSAWRCTRENALRVSS